MPKILFSCFVLLFSFNSFALTIEVIPQKSSSYNKAMLLEINKLSNDAFLNESEAAINDIINKIYAANPRLTHGSAEQLINNIPASAEARAKALAAIKYPALNSSSLKRQAISLFPLYQEGDQVEFIYDPYRRIKVKGKIKRISSDSIFTGFSDRWPIKNIVDPKIRDSFFSAKVEANRAKYIRETQEEQQLNLIREVSNTVQDIADGYVTKNESLGFIYLGNTWHSINELVRSRVSERKNSLLAKIQAEKDKLLAAQRSEEAQAARVKAMEDAQANAEKNAAAQAKKDATEQAARVKALLDEKFTAEQTAAEQDAWLKKQEAEVAEAKRIATEQRRVKGDQRKNKDADAALKIQQEKGAELTAEKITVIILVLLVVGAGAFFVFFKEKFNALIGKKKLTLDQLSGVDMEAPVMAPERQEAKLKNSASLSDQAAASRAATDDGSKIEKAPAKKRAISFSKDGDTPSEPSSSFVSPEAIAQEAPPSTPIAPSALTPPSGGLTPPGGGLTPPGGGLTPPGGGLTPPSGGLAPPKAGPSDSDTSLITDPNLKPGTKLSLKKN